MKIAGIVCCFVFLILTASFASAQKSSKLYVDGELLVKFKDGAVSARAAEINHEIGAEVVEHFSDLKWQRIKLPAGLSVEQAVSRYKNQSAVEYVQPNYYYHLVATPNDTRFAELYGLAKIGAPAAWDLTTGSRETVVAVIDTGIKYNHEDLAANIWTNAGEIAGNGIDDDGNGFVDDFYGYDFFFNDSDPLDENGHGTHVAGTIGAVGNNNLGVVGVNWNVKIMTVKIYDNDGFGSTSAMLINAYNYVRIMKNRGVNIRVTNNSYSGCDEACGYDQATKDALDAMGDAGILNVIAAGNDARNIETTPAFPASYTSPSVISVAASSANDTKPGFSNFGAASVDLAAPGVGILSTFGLNLDYASLSGTSMATPHVAGAAALLASYNPNLSAASLKATLMNTVDALPAWNGVVKTGGRLNADRALRNQTVCDFTLSRNSQQVLPAGGTFGFTVNAPANCDFSAVSSVDWITITNGNPGSGNGAVNYTVSAYSSGNRREGAIIVAGQIFRVIQEAELPPPSRVYLDFDGEGRTDYSVIENASGGMLWHNYLSRDGYRPVNFGLFNDDIPVPALFDGDAKTDIAVWRSSTGTFYVLRSADNTLQAIQFGTPGDDPRVTQDFDGDGKADFAVARRSGGNLFWYILGTTSGFAAVQFGLETDIPLRGDYDGDARADIAVFRPASGTWFILKSSGGFSAVNFGLNTDRIVPADYDGDAKTDIAVWRPSSGVWHYLKSSDGSYSALQFGQNGDLPTQGDYDGDGKTDFSVWRPNAGANESGVFHVFSLRSGYNAVGWGNSTMKITADAIQNQ
jgi:subtilisin family serine protease